MTTTPVALSPTELGDRAARLPRVSLGHFPTPLEELSRLSQKLRGPRIFMKRDDCSGLLFGGNKTRHNEFILGQAVAAGSDMVVWGAGVQSNNCRQTAAGCAKLGLPCHLVLTRADHSDEIQGNLLLDYIVGATVEFTDIPMGPELWATIGRVADRYRAQGRRPFAINDPRVRPSGAVSYAVGMTELLDQLAERELSPDAIYVSSCGVTGAGLFLGKKLLGLACPIHAISPIVWPGDNHAMLADIASAAAHMLNLDERLTKDEITLSFDYIGPGYGKPSLAGMEATRLLAQTEGILLDPVYTAKAFAGLIADIRAGRFSRDQCVVFIHTGGTPALFAYQAEFVTEFGPASHGSRIQG